MDLINKYAPDAAFFVDQIIPSTTLAIQDRIEGFNSVVPDTVKAYVKKGKKNTSPWCR